ncbi:hypothetical protein BST61_g3741 [Cercospora zeina]
MCTIACQPLIARPDDNIRKDLVSWETGSSDQHKKSFLNRSDPTSFPHQSLPTNALNAMYLSKPTVITAVWQSAWNRLRPASETACAALAVDGRDYHNEIIFWDVAGAASLMEQRLQPHAFFQHWQRYAKDARYLLRSLVPPVWSEMDFTNAAHDSFQSIQELVAAQSVGTTGETDWTGRRNANAQTWPDGPNICLQQRQTVPYYKLDQGEDVTSQGRSGRQPPTTYPPTGAAYETWFNLVDEIIINRRAVGSKAAAQRQAQWRGVVPQDSQLPSIYLWSDLVFTGWIQSLRSDVIGNILRGPINWPKASQKKANKENINDFHEMRKFLNFIIIQATDGPTTTSKVIKACLMSQVNKGIAYLLAQHKSEPNEKFRNGIGHKVLEYVGISSGKMPEDPDWYSYQEEDGTTKYGNRHTQEISREAPDGFEEPDMAEWKWGFSPTLIWKVVDFDNSIVERARTNEQQWSEKPLSLNGFCGSEGQQQEPGQGQSQEGASGYSGKGKGRAHDM